MNSAIYESFGESCDVSVAFYYKFVIVVYYIRRGLYSVDARAFSVHALDRCYNLLYQLYRCLRRGCSHIDQKKVQLLLYSVQYAYTTHPNGLKKQVTLLVI
jgi:hypothetical protein